MMDILQTKKEKVFKYFRIIQREQMLDNLDYYLYEKATADGQSIYVSTKTPNSISIPDDVYYYADSELSDEVVATIVEYWEDTERNPIPFEIYVDEEVEDLLEDAIEELILLIK